MTAKELIEELQKLPQDTEVFCMTEGFESTRCNTIKSVNYDRKYIRGMAFGAQAYILLNGQAY